MMDPNSDLVMVDKIAAKFDEDEEFSRFVFILIILSIPQKASVMFLLWNEGYGFAICKNHDN